MSRVQAKEKKDEKTKVREGKRERGESEGKRGVGRRIEKEV